jgi:transcriptional regulator with XRE-family HTH domain
MRQRLVDRRQDMDPPMSQEQLAHAVGIHVKTLSKIERGHSMPHVSTRKRLADALHWTMAELALALSDDDARPPNGHNVPNDLSHYASCEQGAKLLQTFNAVTLHGLLQTREYATHVERAWPLGAPAENVARRVRQRLARQRVLDSGLELQALIDRSILARTTGGPAVMLAQLDHLRGLTERPNVEIRVVPLDQRAHVVGQGEFTLFTGEARETPYMVATHNALGPEYWEFPTMVGAYSALFAHLWSVSDGLEKVDVLV